MSGIGHDRIDHRRGLIVKDAFRLRGQRAGDGNGPLVAGRQVGGIDVAKLQHVYQS